MKELAVLTPLALLTIAGYLFWIWMLLDCLKREPGKFGTFFTKTGDLDKVVWFAFLVVSIFVGAIAYWYFIWRKQSDMRV